MPANIMNAEPPNPASPSVLAQANKALREGRLAEAVGLYLQAAQANPGLAKTVAANLALARRKYKESGTPGRPRVAVCGWELSHNAAGRAYTLAGLYASFAEVEMIGCVFGKYGKRLWSPLAGASIPVRSILVEQESRFFEQAVALVAAQPYDIVHLSKPRAPNIFIGILYKLIWDARILVDVDDEELSFVGCDQAISIEAYLKAHGELPPLKNLDGPDWTRLSVGLAKAFDGLTVSNSELRRRYGGEIVRHARDERLYQPSPALKRASREKYGIPQDKKVVLFLGTPREHKGLLEVADAIAALAAQDVVFAIIGDFRGAGLKQKLLEKKGVEYFFLGNQPFEQVPELVAMGDCCVLLQNPDAQAARFQVPAKLSDALGMGLPVIASDAAPLADLSPGRAFVSVPHDGLAWALSKVLREAGYAEALSQSAREVFAAELSFSANVARLQAALAAPSAPPNAALADRHRRLLLQKTPAAYLAGLSGGGEAAPPPASQPPEASGLDWQKHECLARLERVDLRSVSGWAVATGNRQDTVILRVDMNGQALHLVDTHRPRPDVKSHHGGDGYAGYLGELTEYLDFSGAAEISVSPVSHVLAAESRAQLVPMKYPSLFKGRHFSDINGKARKITANHYWPLPREGGEAPPGGPVVSIIILNLNGLQVLRRCLESLFEHCQARHEVIVVDHNSTDGSVEYLKSIGRENFKAICRDKNYSFSESNNLAAGQAKGDILLFLNNDIILYDDAVAAMARVLERTDFGLLGIKLWDMPQKVPESVSVSLQVVQHVGVHFRGTGRANLIEAFETRPGSFFDSTAELYETPAVTAAMMAIRKADFFRVGGFDPAYFYGQEDVDFCLRYLHAGLGRAGVLLTHGAYHARGLSRRILSGTNNAYLQDNRTVLQQKMAAWFRRRFRADQIRRDGYWNPKPYAVAMVVSDIGFETDKADYFTARELGDAIERDTDAVVGYFAVDGKDIDVSGYDAVVVYIDGFDPARLANLSPSTLLIAWARNWFDRWCGRHWIQSYDLVFASSELARAYMAKTLGRRVGLLRIAASNACLEDPEKTGQYASDYCFTGSFFNSPREIFSQLQPAELPFTFKLFGHHWEGHPQFGAYTLGPVGYQEIPKVYASARLVVDDANIATKQWGSVNCRVYDALAAGTLCVTNNAIGAEEVFGQGFPVYDSKDSLHGHIAGLLSDEGKRERMLEQYRAVILQNHTYRHRAEALFEAIAEEQRKTSVAIKIAAPSLAKAKPWGDLYFAIALRKHLERAGYKVRIDCLDLWHSPRAAGDDVVIVLRGLDRYKPLKTQLNILWVISHPDLLSEAELREYDKIYVAGGEYRDSLAEFTGLDGIEFLPQATDFSPDALDPDKLAATPRHEMLFIGNSRNQYREAVKWSVENGLPLAVYGQGWEAFIPKSHIFGEHIDNADIAYFYRNAKVVVNDHWADMKRRGFVSNRIYDVLGVGGTVLSDHVAGIESLRHSRLFTYAGEADFVEKASRICSQPPASAPPADGFDGCGFSLWFSERCEILARYIEESLGLSHFA
jgi:GT2 family glycosyltransferase/glycosyltransferase involved in cell wall biosynthesis/spore maturation protein CgeB